MLNRHHYKEVKQVDDDKCDKSSSPQVSEISISN